MNSPCSELIILNKNSKTTVFLFTANRPNNQFAPKIGVRIKMPFTPALKKSSKYHENAGICNKVAAIHC